MCKVLKTSSESSKRSWFHKVCTRATKLRVAGKPEIIFQSPEAVFKNKSNFPTFMDIFMNFHKYNHQKSAIFIRNWVLWCQVSNLRLFITAARKNISGKVVTLMHYQPLFTWCNHWKMAKLKTLYALSVIIQTFYCKNAKNDPSAPIFLSNMHGLMVKVWCKFGQSYWSYRAKTFNADGIPNMLKMQGV